LRSPGHFEFASSLHRSLRRRDITGLPYIKRAINPRGKACQKPDRLFRYRHYRKFAPKNEPLYLFVALDRTSKFAYAELHSDRTLRPGVIQALLLRNALEVKKALTSLSDGLQLRRTN
jgi:hypothetical protein